MYSPSAFFDESSTVFLTLLRRLPQHLWIESTIALYVYYCTCIINSHFGILREINLIIFYEETLLLIRSSAKFSQVATNFIIQQNTGGLMKNGKNY